MSKVATPARRVRGRHKGSQDPAVIEFEIAALFSDLSVHHNKTILLTRKLRSCVYHQSADEMFEINVLLKNALRIFADATAHLPSQFHH